MKKLLKVLGFLAVFAMAMFLSTNIKDSDKSVKFNLADAISMSSANAECPWYFTDCGEQPYGEVAEPYFDMCYYSLQDTDNPMVWYTYSYQGEGIACEDAQTIGPLYCEPEPACDEEELPIV